MERNRVLTADLYEKDQLLWGQIIRENGSTSEVDPMPQPNTPKLEHRMGTLKLDSVTPQSEKVISESLCHSSNVSYSSPSFHESQLPSFGVTFIKPEEHGITALIENGFGNLPYKLCEKHVIMSERCIHEVDNVKEVKLRLEQQANERGIKITWAQDSSQEIVVEELPGFEPRTYHWRETSTRNFAISAALGSFPNMFVNSNRVEDSLAPITTVAKKLFFGGVSNNHPLQNPLQHDMPLLKPDFAVGPFINFRDEKILSAINSEVMKITASFLKLIYNATGSFVGTSASPLPILIGEYKKDEGSYVASDVKMMDIVWDEQPEFTFGYFVADREWRVFAMKRDGEKFKAMMVFHYCVENEIDYIYVIEYMYRLAVYTHWALLRVTLRPIPDLLRMLEELNDKKKEQARRKKTSSSSRFSGKPDGAKSPFKGINVAPTAQKENNNPQPTNKASGTHQHGHSTIVEKLTDTVHILQYNGMTLVRKAGAKDNILAEAKNLWRLRGPSVGQLLDYQESDNSLFLPLYDKLPKPTSSRQVVALAKQLLTAIARLHEFKYLHGDIKPGNIVWDYEYQRLRFIDFETARSFVPGESASFYCGTRLFMAPEMLQQGMVNEKSDIFSAGLVIASMIYQQELGSSRDRVALTTAILGNKPSSLSPMSLIKLIAKMLHDDPRHRISAADALSVCQTIEAGLCTRILAKKNRVPQANSKPQPARIPLVPIGSSKVLVTTTKQQTNKHMAMYSLDKENVAPDGMTAQTGRKRGLSLIQ